MKGFTLIELLIVIVIIGILSTGAVALFTNAQRNARDANRKANLTTFATALQMYATDNNNTYPAPSTTAETTQGALVTGGYLQKVVNTGSPTEVYCYTVSGDEFMIYTRLEADDSYYYVGNALTLPVAGTGILAGCATGEEQFAVAAS